MDVDGREGYRDIVVVEGDEEQKLVFALGPASCQIVGRHRTFHGEMLERTAAVVWDTVDLLKKEDEEVEH